MHRSTFVFPLLIGFALVGLVATSSASIIVYEGSVGEAQFDALITTQFTESFGGLSASTRYTNGDSRLTFSDSKTGFILDALGSNGFVYDAPNHALSTSAYSASLTFNFTSGNIYGVGGLFFIPGARRVDSSLVRSRRQWTVRRNLIYPTRAWVILPYFIGFISNDPGQPLNQLTISLVTAPHSMSQSPASSWGTGQAPTPEPSTLLGGLFGVTVVGCGLWPEFAAAPLPGVITADSTTGCVGNSIPLPDWSVVGSNGTTNCVPPWSSNAYTVPLP